MTDWKWTARHAFAWFGYLVGALILHLALAIPAAAKITVDFDPTLDFSKFKTFAFIGGVENLVMIQWNPDLINTRIHRMIVRELEKKGMREVNPEQNPDIVVRYWANPESKVNVAAMGNWGAYSPFIAGGWSSEYNAVASSAGRQNTLILDLIDPKAKTLAWRVYLVRKLSDPDKDWKKAEDEFTEGFKSYPPSDKDKEEKRKEREKEDPIKKAS